ncbi:unnamed protein product [Pedinophyceae sp. YPF-701]|nr:unnamed protein product [Pedinophyceae sp. YPF-701]
MGKRQLNPAAHPHCADIIVELNRCHARSFFDQWWNGSCKALTDKFAECRRQERQLNSKKNKEDHKDFQKRLAEVRGKVRQAKAEEAAAPN